MFRRLFRRARALRHGRGLDRQLDAELQLHLDLEIDRLVRQGLTPADARTAALRTFGGLERVREECRDTRGISWADTLRRNLASGFRLIRYRPGYAVAVVVTLGLGIGANTAMFSVVNGVLLKPLPYASGKHLVVLRQSAPGDGQESLNLSIQELYDYRAQLTHFDGLVEFHQMSFDLIERGEPDRVATGVVSANYFDVLGITPIAGRTFVAADERPGADAVLVLSHPYWQSRFGGDRDIVGQVFQMNDRAHTVVGVLPPIPQYPNAVDVYMPTSACPFRAQADAQRASNRRAFGLLNVFGRLRPGVPREHAASQVGLVADRFRRDHPDVYPAASGFRATALDLLGELTRFARPMLLMLLGATGLVLLLACANVASLTLARTLNRERELALRTALGASRRHLFLQLLTESVVLGVAGGVAGLVVAYAALGTLTAFIARFTPRTGDIAIDGWVLLFTLGIAIGSGVLVGVIPALVSRPSPASALKQSGAAAGSSPTRRHLQHALVVGQVAVSVVLVACAALLLTSLYRLQQVDPGYRPERVLSADVIGNFTQYASAEACLRLYEPLLDRLAREPGVISVAIGTAVPFADGSQPFLNAFEIEGVATEAHRRPATDLSVVSPAYFTTLSVPLFAGRTFLPTDTRDSAPVAVINASMARQWQGRDPVGTRVTLDGDRWFTVVGVVGDVRRYGLERPAESQLYVPLSQISGAVGGRVLLRTRDDPLRMAGVVHEAVRAIDPNLPIENVRTLEDFRASHLATPRLTAVLLTLFAGVALMVSLAGLAGVIATSVSQRTREFGLRMALGAHPRKLLVLVLRQGAVLVVIGLACGMAGALASGHVLTAYLFETEPSDLRTLAVVAAAVLCAGLLACIGPARRATRVDPMIALRSE